MSLASCIPELVATGRIRQSDAEEASRAYNRHYARLSEEMGPDAAAAEASERAVAEMEYAADLKRRRDGLTIMAQRRLDVDAERAAQRGQRPYSVLTGFLKEVEIATQRIEAQSHERILGFIERHRRNLIGNAKDKTGLIDVVNELHGQATGNDTAAAFARAIGETFENLRQRFNRNGGDIRFRADFGLPHRHDALRVRKATYPVWRKAILDGIDVGKMRDPLSGQRFTPDRLEEFLAASYANISTNGLAGEGGPPGSGGGNARMLANRRSDPRFFVFRDGEAWLKYAADYGEGNPFEAVISHIHGLSRDIAFMERFGPNPSASWRRATDRADRADAGGGDPLAGSVKGTSGGRRHADKMWRYMNGDLTVPVFPDTRSSLFNTGARWGISGLHAARDVITSAFLGSAQLTSIADINTGIFARRMNAIPSTGIFMGMLRQLNPLSATDRKRAIYLLGGTRDATRAMLSLSRFFGESHSPRWSQVLADGVLRLTGMNKFFEAGQRLWVDDFAKQLGAERHLPFGELPQQRRDLFDEHGIGEADWDVIRAAEPYREGRQLWVDWHRVAEANPAISDKMLDMMLTEGRSAVIESSAETQAVVRFDRPGTVAGEIGSNIFQFKSFPVALVMDQAQRIARIAERQGKGAAARYAASFVVGMTMFGALSLQLKEIAKGKDMRDMSEPGFWFDALVQGGGLGVFGDLVGSVTRDRIDGLTEFFAGPMVQAGEDAVATVKSFIPNDEGETHGGRQTVKVLRRYTPGTTIWYLRAALDRLVWDELAERIDPDYQDSRDRLEAAAEKQGQGMWWRPGEDFPERLPEFGEKPE